MFTVNETDRRQERARAKAEEVKPEAIETGEHTYVVEGSTRDYYDVKVFGPNVECNCMAGQNGAPCYHAFAALARHAKRQAARPRPESRDDALLTIERDLRFIGAKAAEMGGDFEISESISRAVRDALATLSTYEAGLRAARRAA